MDVPGLGGKFGLTRAEIKIMQGLLHGSSITDIAIEKQPSRETIRSQLKSVVYAEDRRQFAVEIAAARPFQRTGAPQQLAFIQSTNSTVTPGLTIFASSVASQFVRRMQPWLWVRPIFDGSGVP